MAISRSEEAKEEMKHMVSSSVLIVLLVTSACMILLIQERLYRGNMGSGIMFSFWTD